MREVYIGLQKGYMGGVFLSGVSIYLIHKNLAYNDYLVSLQAKYGGLKYGKSGTCTSDREAEGLLFQ